MLKLLTPLCRFPCWNWLNSIWREVHRNFVLETSSSDFIENKSKPRMQTSVQLLTRHSESLATGFPSGVHLPFSHNPHSPSPFVHLLRLCPNKLSSKTCFRAISSSCLLFCCLNISRIVYDFEHSRFPLCGIGESILKIKISYWKPKKVS